MVVQAREEESCGAEDEDVTPQDIKTYMQVNHMLKR